MKIGIISDGKFGDRAYEIIRERFPTEWIMAPFPQSMIAEDLELNLPECDLYIWTSATLMSHWRSLRSRNR